MALLLNKLGLKVDVAVNGLEAIEKLEAKKYAAVLMDVQMPGLDGLEATQRIRDPKSLVLHHQVPIIAVTAHAIEGYREVCQQAGMDDYITKPITLKRLRDILERWLPPVS
jgi:CheY-like chemotaxis protein